MFGNSSWDELTDQTGRARRRQPTPGAVAAGGGRGRHGLAIGPGGGILLEEHRGRPLVGSQLAHQAFQQPGQPRAGGPRQAFDGVDQPLLGRARGLFQQCAGRGHQRQLDPPGVQARALAADQAAVHQPLHDDRDRALVRPGAVCQVVDRQHRRLGKVMQDKQLRTGEPHLLLRRPRRDAERANDPADRIEDRPHVLAAAPAGGGNGGRGRSFMGAHIMTT